MLNITSVRQPKYFFFYKIIPKRLVPLTLITLSRCILIRVRRAQGVHHDLFKFISYQYCVFACSYSDLITDTILGLKLRFSPVSYNTSCYIKHEIMARRWWMISSMFSIKRKEHWGTSTGVGAASKRGHRAVVLPLEQWSRIPSSL